MKENNVHNEEETLKIRKFTFQDFVQLVLSNWYWFALSILICWLCAAFYIRRTSPVYQRSASVLVKDSRKGSSSEMTAFSDLVGGGMLRHSVDTSSTYSSRAALWRRSSASST